MLLGRPRQRKLLRMLQTLGASAGGAEEWRLAVPVRRQVISTITGANLASRSQVVSTRSSSRVISPHRLYLQPHMLAASLQRRASRLQMACGNAAASHCAEHDAADGQQWPASRQGPQHRCTWAHIMTSHHAPPCIVICCTQPLDAAGGVIADLGAVGQLPPTC